MIDYLIVLLTIVCSVQEKDYLHSININNIAYPQPLLSVK